MSQTVRAIPDQDLDRLDLGEVRRFLKRRGALILVTTVIFALGAMVVCLGVTPVYTATSQVLLDPPKQRVFGQEGMAGDSALDSSVVDSQIPIILSTRTLSHVVTREQLADDPEFGQPARGLLNRIFGLVGATHATKVETPPLDGIDPKIAPVMSRLLDRIDVSRIAKSNVLSITVSSRDANKAMRLANAVAQAYVADQVDVHARSIQQAATFFEDRLGNLRNQVRTSERAVAEFRKQNGLATTTDEKVTVSEQQLTNLNEKLATASSDTAEKYAKYQQAVRFKGGAGDLDTLSDVVRSPVINQLRAQQADVARREADLLVTYGSAYPAVAQIRAQRQGIDSAIAGEMKRVVSTLKNDYDVAKAREESLRHTMTVLGNPSGGDNDIAVKLRELERTNLANKALFENFLNKAKLTQEQSTFEAPDARVISPAIEPLLPSFPKTKLIVPMAAVLGLISGLALGAGLDLQRGKPVLRRQQAPVAPQARTQAPAAERYTRQETIPTPRRQEPSVLGCIPTIVSTGQGEVGGASSAVTYMERHPTSAFSRGIHGVAGQLLRGEGDLARVVMLSPLVEGEGCSTLVRCIASLMGATGKRVLLIDADPVRRTLTAGLSLSSHAGLAEVLMAGLPIAEAVVPQKTFAFLPVGQMPFDPSDSASGQAIQSLLTEAKGRFDLILIDGPASHDNSLIADWARLVDGMVMVARWDQLLKDAFVTTVDALSAAPTFIGLVLNRTVAPADASALGMTG